MLRNKLIDKKVGAEKHFNWRSHEPVRLESFSDAVFANQWRYNGQES